MKLLTETSAALLSNGAKMEVDESKRIVWKLVLTGGPCGGKTTGQARLSTFFENLGWKVYRVPEMATVIIPGGVNFAELDSKAAMRFQVSNQISYCHTK